MLPLAADTPVPAPSVQVPIVPVPAPGVPAAQAWLGLQMSKADPATATQIPGLPPGIGMLVRSVSPGGPAEAAKVQPYDVVWKLGDQMLVNEAQLATLLRLSKPGEEVKLSIFRAGKLIEMKMKLGDTPEKSGPAPGELAEAAILPGEIAPMRMVNFAERTASYSSDEGKAVLRKDGETYLVVIRNPKDEVIFEGDVSSKERIAGLPQGWQRRVCSLRHGLDHSIEAGMVPVRPPRPRVLPAPVAPAKP